MTIVREFTREVDGVSGRIVVTQSPQAFTAVVVGYRTDRTDRVVLDALRGAQTVTATYPGQSGPGTDLTPYVQERLTHNVPVTTEYHMSLVAMRWLGIVT
ncbi:MAG TPA: hypothetical protein VHK27_04985 [Gammaproteobacteria bacterium]|nr:hypothetical protein [Gammaproteobacteria bacterium]